MVSNAGSDVYKVYKDIQRYVQYGRLFFAMSLWFSAIFCIQPVSMDPVPRQEQNSNRDTCAAPITSFGSYVAFLPMN
eukprot:scaffold29765_cov21-Tisochrysis_lutea.AAC.2